MGEDRRPSLVWTGHTPPRCNCSGRLVWKDMRCGGVQAARHPSVAERVLYSETARTTKSGWSSPVMRQHPPGGDRPIIPCGLLTGSRRHGPCARGASIGKKGGGWRPPLFPNRRPARTSRAAAGNGPSVTWESRVHGWAEDEQSGGSGSLPRESERAAPTTLGVSPSQTSTLSPPATDALLGT